MGVEGCEPEEPENGRSPAPSGLQEVIHLAASPNRRCMYGFPLGGAYC